MATFMGEDPEACPNTTLSKSIRQLSDDLYTGARQILNLQCKAHQNDGVGEVAQNIGERCCCRGFEAMLRNSCFELQQARC